MENMKKLRLVFADNYKLCCPAVLPAGFPQADCHAPSDEISSCDTLLRSDLFRLFLYVFAVLGLIGNAGSFLYRMVINKAECKQGFSVFVAHLCASDFLMGLYLTAIAIADKRYQGSYLWEDVTWRNSVVCKAAGFLSFVSCEVSTFIICLITVDRFLVLRFPFSQCHFRKNSAQTACLLSWLIGIVLALLPLLQMTSHWEFYKQSSICLPLPVTRQYFKGQAYSFSVMVVLNFILFLLIAVGQAFIYHAIRTNSMSMVDTSKSSSKELTIARRLITVAMSDFLCWFPIGFLGLLASQNMAIPGEVRVGLAIFVLPLNSALNPFLYTLNVIREKRKQAYFKKLQGLFQSQQQIKTTDVSVNRHQ
ncbi:relaxin receptor 2-like [Babylonia areolata]|uniref:relaxin receptor 2-like n=1 Tax=Babylonia areolata TaxID=304850 RepID=UPI003FD52907